jgi:hypothetical protein
VIVPTLSQMAVISHHTFLPIARAIVVGKSSVIGVDGGGVDIVGKLPMSMNEDSGVDTGVRSSEGVKSGDWRGKRLRCRCRSNGTVSDRNSDDESKGILRAFRNSVWRDPSKSVRPRLVLRVEGAIF